MRFFLLITILLLPLGCFAQDTLNLLFVGDVMQHQGQIDAAKTDSGYRFVWTYRPMVNGKKQFHILPVADFENEPDYFTTPAEYKKMTDFAKNMRELYESENIGFVEYK